MPQDKRPLILFLAAILVFGGLFAASLVFGLDPVMHYAGSFLDRIGLVAQ